MLPRILYVLSVFGGALIAQQGVPPGLAYHRVWAVTPLAGTGQKSDAARPMFAPAPPPPGPSKTAASIDRSGLLGYQMQLSDDGKFALVEMVFQDPASFQATLRKEASARGLSVPLGASAQAVLESAVPGLKIFERGKSNQNDILTEFRKHKKDFTFAGGTVRPQ